MQKIISHLSTRSSSYQANYRASLGRLDEFQRRQDRARTERPKRDLDRLERLGKNFIRDRINMLLDPGSPFLELSSLAAGEAYGGEAPAASSVVGIGVVAGREVVIRADDPSVKGGAWYPLTIKKIVRALDIAIENHLPVVHLCDSAGGNLQMQSGLFADKYYAGRIFRNQSKLSKMGVPQLSVVLGHCTAGGAYIPGLSDYSVIVRGNGGVFLGGPPLVKAATGEIVSADDLGGADLHTSISGTADYPANDENHAFAIAREIVGQWRIPTKSLLPEAPVDEPFYDPQELYGIIPDDPKQQFDMREVIARIVDGSLFHEYQPAYGETLVCGYARIFGYRVGLLANNGILFNDSSLKAAHFMELCAKNKTPLVFLQNITGYMVGREYEMRGITKDGAKMIMVQTNVEVPKFTVMVNGSFGAGNYGMCGRAFDARFLFGWPNYQISVMGAEQAAKTLTDVKIKQREREGLELSASERKDIYEAVMDDFQMQSSAYYATSELWDDGLIDPVDTRASLSIAISAAGNAPAGDPNANLGVLRL
ncbi:MAG: carboxyl transferase domain-containing protein [Pseudomonadota bacterium]